MRFGEVLRDRSFARKYRAHVERRTRGVIPVAPDVSVLPNPADGPVARDAYDRHFILEEGVVLSPRVGVGLSAGELTHTALAWAGTHYPRSYGTQALRLLFIKRGWGQENPSQRNENPTGWLQTLQNNRWRKYVPQTDFEEK